jgi:hypothetical protein
VFYYYRTYYKAVRVGGGRIVEDMCYESGTREETGTLTQGAPVFLVPECQESGGGGAWVPLLQCPSLAT